MAIYLFLQILKFTKYIIKLIEKLSRRHLINSFDVFVIKGFTVLYEVSTFSKCNAFINFPCIITLGSRTAYETKSLH